MPRNPNNSDEFVAGILPTVQIKNPDTGSVNSYFVDGRLQELRNVNDFMDKITSFDDKEWDLIPDKVRSVILYEFYGF